MITSWDTMFHEEQFSFHSITVEPKIDPFHNLALPPNHVDDTQIIHPENRLFVKKKITGHNTIYPKIFQNP